LDVQRGKEVHGAKPTVYFGGVVLKKSFVWAVRIRTQTRILVTQASGFEKKIEKQRKQKQTVVADSRQQT
jgi:hypothetical protein